MNMAELAGDAPDVVSLLDCQLGSDVADLHKCKELYRQALEKQKNLRARIFRANEAASSQVEQALHEAETAANSLKSITAVIGTLEDNIQKHASEVAPQDTLTQLSELLRPVAIVNKYRAYLTWIDAVGHVSSKIKSSLLIDAHQQAAEHYGVLVSYLYDISCSQCVNLVKFVKDSAIYWHELIRKQLSLKLDKLLREANWPRVTAVMKDAIPVRADDHSAQFEHLIKVLLTIQLPERGLADYMRGRSHAVVNSLPEWKPLLLPVELLVEPLRKRFKYHFMGKKQTNDPAKPEWYLTQVLHWIRDNCDYLVQTVQPILRACGHPFFDMQVEFTRAMVQLVLEKVATDLPGLVYDDHTFAHLIDELLAFDKDLHDIYDYPRSAPSCLHVLAADEPLRKWLSIERKFATEKIDGMLSSPGAWKPQCTTADSADEETKVPECADGLIALMAALTERYKNLPYVVCRLLFLDLQLELLDDVRVRLLQIMKQELSGGGKTLLLTARFSGPLNTLRCLADAVAEWNELPFFIRLQFYNEKYGPSSNWKNLLSKDASGLETCSDSDIADAASPAETLSFGHSSVFDETLRLYAHVERDMLAALVHHASTDVRAKARIYADSSRSAWTTMPSKKEMTFVSLSTTACGMLLTLQEHLQAAQALLAHRAFVHFWHQVADELDSFIFTKVVGDNYFNEGGAAQFHFDMTRNLFPIFGKYTPKPENFFKRTKEAAILLTMLPGTAILLKDILKRALHALTPSAAAQDPVAAVQEHGVYRLSPEDCELVLSRRLDIVPT